MRPEARLEAAKAGPTAHVLQGQGEPVVLIHGVGMAQEIWAPQVESLARDHQVITYDLLGHGLSDPPPQDVTLEHYAQQLADLMDHLGLAAANLVGHSMGALVALEFALTWPRRTLRVAALNAVFERSAEQRAAVMARAAALGDQGPGASVSPTLARWFGDPVIPGLEAAAAQVGRLLREVHPTGYARTYALFAASDRAHAGRLASLERPALFMTGEHDPNSSPAMSAAMAARVPGARLEVLPDARHMMTVTHPAQVNARLHRFLSEPLEGAGR